MILIKIDEENETNYLTVAVGSRFHIYQFIKRSQEATKRQLLMKKIYFLFI